MLCRRDKAVGVVRNLGVVSHNRYHKGLPLALRTREQPDNMIQLVTVLRIHRHHDVVGPIVHDVGADHHPAITAFATQLLVEFPSCLFGVLGLDEHPGPNPPIPGILLTHGIIPPFGL